MRLSAALRIGRFGGTKTRAVLENKLVRQRLQDFGYSADEVAGRLRGPCNNDLAARIGEEAGHGGPLGAQKDPDGRGEGAS